VNFVVDNATFGFGVAAWNDDDLAMSRRVVACRRAAVIHLHSSLVLGITP
jgi:hypothetical protein